jgi:hypothetical protein
MTRKVVVTGLGATTPVAGTAKETWQGILAGKSGIRLLPYDWAADVAVKFAGTVAVEPLDQGLEKAKARRLDRSQQFAIVTAREAWADSGLELDSYIILDKNHSQDIKTFKSHKSIYITPIKDTILLGSKNITKGIRISLDEVASKVNKPYFKEFDFNKLTFY